MKKKFLIISLAMSGFAFSQTNDNTCDGITSKGTNCKIKVNKKITNLCHWHHPDSLNVNRCTSISKSTNNQCKLKTKHESGKCHHHRSQLQTKHKQVKIIIWNL